jgi:hypothetical protein
MSKHKEQRKKERKFSNISNVSEEDKVPKFAGLGGFLNNPE